MCDSSATDLPGVDPPEENENEYQCDASHRTRTIRLQNESTADIPETDQTESRKQKAESIQCHHVCDHRKNIPFNSAWCVEKKKEERSISISWGSGVINRSRPRYAVAVPWGPCGGTNLPFPFPRWRRSGTPLKTHESPCKSNCSVVPPGQTRIGDRVHLADALDVDTIGQE